MSHILFTLCRAPVFGSALVAAGVPAVLLHLLCIGSVALNDASEAAAQMPPIGGTLKRTMAMARTSTASSSAQLAMHRRSLQQHAPLHPSHTMVAGELAAVCLETVTELLKLPASVVIPSLSVHAVLAHVAVCVRVASSVALLAPLLDICCDATHKMAAALLAAADAPVAASECCHVAPDCAQREHGAVLCALSLSEALHAAEDTAVAARLLLSLTATLQASSRACGELALAGGVDHLLVLVTADNIGLRTACCGLWSMARAGGGIVLSVWLYEVILTVVSEDRWLLTRRLCRVLCPCYCNSLAGGGDHSSSAGCGCCACVQLRANHGRSLSRQWRYDCVVAGQVKALTE